jgi:hypothetical protein
MSPVVIFVGVLAWGWLWGRVGADPGVADPDGGEDGLRPRESLKPIESCWGVAVRPIPAKAGAHAALVVAWSRRSSE